MSSKPFHLGWFMDGFRPPAWNTRYEGTTSKDWMTGEFFVDAARAVERAGMDFMLIADSSYVADIYQGDTRVTLKYGQTAPTHDPNVIVPMMAQRTSHLGIIPTLSVTEWRPYHLARYLATASHVSDGRVGWNVVTSSSDRAAQNFGIDGQPPHDERYEIADEFVDVVKQLWGSWEEDALVMDRATGTYADGAKVRTIDHDGRYFRTRGPLTTLPPRHGQPVITQAGASPRGQQFAAQHADIVLTSEMSIDGLKRYRTSLDENLARAGRKPADVRMFFLASPVVGDTDADARERAERTDAEAQANFEMRLAQMSSHWGIDLSTFALDEPLPPDLTTNGHLGILRAAVESRQTLRQIMGGTKDRASTSGQTVGVVGSPRTVAGRLAELVDEVGADGVLLIRQRLDRRYLNEILDGVVPHLQRMGRTRDGFTHANLRDNLFEF